jgi:Abortive infection C-terminus
MSNLTAGEKRKLERLFGMGSGYVLGFSNRTFSEFVLDSTGREIYNVKYEYGSGSKANRLRGFWNEEPNGVAAKLVADLLDYMQEGGPLSSETGPVAELEALTSLSAEADFDALAKEVRAAIEKNEPQSGLDRLHTFVTKYVRSLCEQRAISVERDKALHSLFGEYVKRLRQDGHLESEMTERILRSSISTLESFNHVRNNQSFAHDNPLLNYDEALLIFNHVAASIRFLRSLEKKLRMRERERAQPSLADDEIPF